MLSLSTLFRIANETQWNEMFYFVQLFAPDYEVLSGFIAGHVGENKLEEVYQHVIFKPISEMNKLNPPPKFVLLTAPLRRLHWSDDHYQNVINSFEKLVAEIHSNIPLVLISEPVELNSELTKDQLTCYKKHFGEDHYDFVIGGVKFIVTNSNYQLSNTLAVSEAADEHEAWLELSLREARRTGYKHVVVVRHAVSKNDSTWLSRGATSVAELDDVFTEAAAIVKLEREGVDYLLTYEGRREARSSSTATDTNSSGKNGSNSGTLSTDGKHQVRLSDEKGGGLEHKTAQLSPPRDHTHILSTRENSVHETHHDHEDHLAISHAHHHAFYNALPRPLPPPLLLPSLPPTPTEDGSGNHTFNISHDNVTQSLELSHGQSQNKSEPSALNLPPTLPPKRRSDVMSVQTSRMSIQLSTNVDDNQYRIVWMFEKHIENQLFTAVP